MERGESEERSGRRGQERIYYKMSRERKRRREEGQKSSKREICLNQCHSLKVEYIYT